MTQLFDKLRNQRLSAIAIVVAVFAQFAVVTHSVLVEHSPGEHCEVCIGQDRTDDALTSGVATLFEQVQLPVSVTPYSSQLVSRAGATVRNRGPPLL